MPETITTKKGWRKKLPLYLLCIIICLLILLPLSLLVISSLKTNREIMTNPIALPTTPVWKNYVDAWKGAKIGTYFFNSLSYCLVSVAITSVVAAAASFAFAKMRLRATKYLYPLLLSGTTIPVLSIIIPIYFMLSRLKLINSFAGIVAVYVIISLPFAIMIMTASMKQIPDSLIESAVIDGCSLPMVFFRIILPLFSTSILTVGIITFIRLWNDFLIALVLNQKSSAYTLAVGLKAFVGEHSIQYSTLTAGLLLAVVPPIILYFILQERIVEGLMAGSVKG